MSNNELALKEYSKEFDSKFHVIEQQYIEPYGWPEMDTLRYEICGCLSFGLNQAAITLTNHLLESLLKYALSYKYSLDNSSEIDTGSELVEAMMKFTDEGFKKYGDKNLCSNINEAKKIELITESEHELLHAFRMKFRNPFGHSDKAKTFGNLSSQVFGAVIENNKLVSRPSIEAEIARLPIMHGLVQARIAEIEAPEYFIAMDSLVRVIKIRVFPNA